MHSQWARIHYVGRVCGIGSSRSGLIQSSVTTCSFRAPPPIGPFTNVDSVARKPGEHNSIHDSMLRFVLSACASFVARCSSWIPDSGTQDSVPFCRCSNFLSWSSSVCFYLFSSSDDNDDDDDDHDNEIFAPSRALELLERREKERRQRRRRGEILQVTVSGQYLLPPIY